MAADLMVLDETTSPENGYGPRELSWGPACSSFTHQNGFGTPRRLNYYLALGLPCEWHISIPAGSPDGFNRDQREKTGYPRSRWRVAVRRQPRVNGKAGPSGGRPGGHDGEPSLRIQIRGRSHRPGATGQTPGNSQPIGVEKLEGCLAIATVRDMIVTETKREEVAGDRSADGDDDPGSSPA